VVYPHVWTQRLLVDLLVIVDTEWTRGAQDGACT
jgi:hypothetical protein